MMFTPLNSAAIRFLVLVPLASLAVTDVYAKDLTLDPALAKITASCKSAKGGARAWIFKQWHADPSIDTRAPGSGEKLPQAANQKAIYRQLDRWISGGGLDTVVAEGCVGELDRESPVRFNEWTVAALEAVSKRDGFDGIVASVPQKLEARHGARVKTLCGDDEALIKAHLRAFSDVRGTFGYLSRLTQYENDSARASGYLDDVIKLYRLPKGTTIRQARARLGLEIKRAMKRLHEALDRRNAKVVEAIAAAGKARVAVVYGGVHAPGLVKLLEARGMPCSVVEPAGYANDEAALIRELDRAIGKLASE